jgi:hypothetical protein
MEYIGPYKGGSKKNGIGETGRAGPTHLHCGVGESSGAKDRERRGDVVKGAAGAASSRRTPRKAKAKAAERRKKTRSCVCREREKFKLPSPG